MPATEETTPAKEKTYFSIDYDDCGCILNPETTLGRYDASTGLYVKYISPKGYIMGSRVDWANRYPIVPIAIHIFKDILEATIASFKGDKDGAFFVGSARQSKRLDHGNAMVNKNGSCLEVFNDYAQLSGLALRPLLAADEDNGFGRQPKAMAMAMAQPSPQLEGHLECKPDPLKHRLIYGQLKDIARDNPKGKNNLVFFDDDAKNTIIPHLQEELPKYFASSMLKDKLPKKVNVFLIKFDWFPLLQEALQLSMKGHDIGFVEKWLRGRATTLLGVPIILEFGNSEQKETSEDTNITRATQNASQQLNVGFFKQDAQLNADGALGNNVKREKPDLPSCNEDAVSKKSKVSLENQSLSL